MNALKILIALAVAITMVTGVSAAYDGGDAVAIQSNDQSNSNTQVGIASAENSAEQDQSQEIEVDLGDFLDNGNDGRPPQAGGT